MADLPAAAVRYAIDLFLLRAGADHVADRVHIGRFGEGLCAQLMHHGPYAEEGPDIARLHNFATAQGLRLRLRH